MATLKCWTQICSYAIPIRCIGFAARDSLHKGQGKSEGESVKGVIDGGRLHFILDISLLIFSGLGLC